MPGGGVVGGPRQYEGPTLGHLGAWKCPSCGVENSGPLDAGCTSCHAGSAKPYHVGVQPPITREPAAEQQGAGDFAGVQSKPAAHGFDQWVTSREGAAKFPPALRALLLDAWNAAIIWHMQLTPIEPSAGIVPQPSDDTLAVPRGLLNKVIEILEGTTDLPEDQQSDDLRSLIAQLKELME